MSIASQQVGTSAQADLGVPEVNPTIVSSLGPFTVLPAAQIVYPEVVVQALGELFAEYNRAFKPLIEANREWDADYQYAVGPNFAVQIDMVGLQPDLLDRLAGLPVEEVREELRPLIFEIENSIAMYQLLVRIFADEHGASFFGVQWRAMLDDLRRFHRKPIALLAVTHDKYQAMLTTEFGVQPGEELTNEQVQELSGFDAFFGPDEFRAHVEANGGECDYLLYVRSSDPVARLRKPRVVVDHPLLADPELRRLIKANALTLNVDDPTEGSLVWRINDTKAYMPEMGMGFAITTMDDLRSDAFAGYLAGFGIDLQEVLDGSVMLRAKPAGGTYGCYGHVRGLLTQHRFRNELARNLRQRGGYIVQLELPASVVINTATEVSYSFIDRVWIACRPGDSDATFCLGGFRNYMPTNSTEADEGRIHGNGEAVWGQIVPGS